MKYLMKSLTDLRLGIKSADIFIFESPSRPAGPALQRTYIK